MINPGEYKVDINIVNQIHQYAIDINNDDKNYKPKIRNGNTFKKVSKELKLLAEQVIYSLPDADKLDWHFEIFCSRNPVSKHNDRNYYEETNLQCQRGFILPLEWKGKEPSTIIFDKWYNDKIVTVFENNKLIFKKLVGRETIIDTGIDFTPDDCNIIDNFIWKKGKCLIFDSSQVHSSSNFIINESSYKLSLNALGYTVGKIN